MFSENIIFDLPLHIRYNPLHCFANLTSKNLKQSTSPGFSPSFSNTQNRKAKHATENHQKETINHNIHNTKNLLPW